MTSLPEDMTRILAAAAAGGEQASEELLALVYNELRQLAAAKMARESSGHTLQATALVHEAWLRVAGNAGDSPPLWRNRAHFFGAAALAMQRILIDKARRRQAQRRGGDHEHLPIDDVDIAAPAADDQVLLLNDALNLFAAENPEKAELVRLRYFVGLGIEEAAAVLGISERTAKRHWTYAKAWLLHEMKKG